MQTRARFLSDVGRFFERFCDSDVFLRVVYPENATLPSCSNDFNVFFTCVLHDAEHASLSDFVILTCFHVQNWLSDANPREIIL